MKQLFSKVKRWIENRWEFLQRENLTFLVRWLLFLGLFTLILSIVVYFIELNLLEYLPEEQKNPQATIKKPFDVFWWIIVTVTTVGYGDKFPQTIPGRFFAVFVIFYGNILILVINGFVVNFIGNKKIIEEQGLTSYKFEDHIILCEWNYRSKMIVKELRLDSKTKRTRIVLIANIDKKPIDDPNLFFVKGNVNEETLDKANLKKAKTVIILGDDNLDYVKRDVKVVSSTLLVETKNPDAYTIVELISEKYFVMCETAKADEIIVLSNFSSHLIAHTIINNGISKVVSNMLSKEFDDNQLRKIPVPEDAIDAPFLDVFIRMKQYNQSIIIAIQNDDTRTVIFNPPSEYRLKKEENFIVIANNNKSLYFSFKA